MYCVMYHLYIQLMRHALCATMETSDWSADRMTMKGEWKCVLMIPGALSVMMGGMIMMLG